MTRAWLLRRLAGDARRHVAVWLAIGAAFAVVGFSAAGARLVGVGRRAPAPPPPAARVIAYLEDDLSSMASIELQRVLTTLPGVEAVRPVSPRESLDLLRRELGARADVIAGVGSDLLPSSLEIVARPSEAEALAFRMRRLRGVADADFVPAPPRAVATSAAVDAGGRLRLGVALTGALGLLAAAAALLLLRARVRVELGLWLALGLPRAASARPVFWLASLAAVLGAALGVVGAICASRAWLGAPPLPASELAAGAAVLLLATLGASRLAVRVPEVAGA
jgi:cell division protein FtsX